jgi:dTDP-glucose 4,6-dehydratase
MSQTILITGGAGFIGSNFIPYFMNAHKDVKIINLDLLTYAGNLENLKEIESSPNYTFIQGDICDYNLINDIFNKYHPTGVIHFAAESHVDNSITGPRAFINTNILGTFNLLEACRTHWYDAPFTPKEGCENYRFHHISTDEVFGSLGETGFFKETTPYAPNSPYSASKASSDFLVRAYHHTFGLNTTTSNCSNNYGPKQHSEKLIPTIIRNCLNQNPIPIYGNGQNIRDWLYVEDHAQAIDLIYHNGKNGETYNVGGHNELTNLEITHTICAILDNERPLPDNKKYSSLITFVKDRAGHDKRYAIDPTKLETELSYTPKETFQTGIIKTVKWYLEQQ